MITEFSPDIQQLFLRMMITDPELYTRVSNILNADNFDKSLRPIVKFMIEYAEKYKAVPDSIQIKAAFDIDIDLVPDMGSAHTDFFLDQFEAFTKRQELERAILKAADLIDKREFDPVEKLIKDAVQISLQKDMGTDYFADPKSRLMSLRDVNKRCTTGWPTLDGYLAGGWDRGTLNIFAGNSGAGKSVIMQNLAVNMIQTGMHGAYITLELSEELCASRMDSMTTGIGVQDVLRNIDKVEQKVRLMSRKAGKLQIKYMQAQSTTNQIRAYCRELEIKTGVKLDFICVDYLDLLMPSGAKVDMSNLFIKDKLVSEELRNIAKEFNLICITGSQFNRSAVDETEFNAASLSGGISKQNTADNVIGIFTSRSMRERGQYQFQLMKTRNSGGVGQKLELAFNTDTLRITDDESNKDYGDSDNRDMGTTFRPRINETVNHDGVIETIEPEKTSAIKRVVGADVQSNRLKNLLTSLKKSQ